MDADFWHDKWRKNEIGFHEPKTNPLLIKHLETLALAPASRVLLPLCGKTLDIGWLLANGYKVVGVELVESAIEQLFEELNVEPVVSQMSQFKHFKAPNLDIYVGDVFAVSRDSLGPVDAVYDRAALVALPDTMRQRYTRHLIDISSGAPQLLLTFEYDQSLMIGPPFSVSNEEVRQHYDGTYELTLLHSAKLPGGLKGQWQAIENVWRLLPLP